MIDLTEGDEFIPVSTTHTANKYGASKKMRQDVRQGRKRTVDHIGENEYGDPLVFDTNNIVWHPADIEKVKSSSLKCTVKTRPL